MASKTREITITTETGAFTPILKRFKNIEENYDFEGISLVRKLLSNEKARILHTIKTKSPNSIYSLAKLLGRDFKAVTEDIKLLERFGFIDMVSERTGKRERLRPRLIVDSINLIVKL